MTTKLGSAELNNIDLLLATRNGNKICSIVVDGIEVWIDSDCEGMLTTATIRVGNCERIIAIYADDASFDVAVAICEVLDEFKEAQEIDSDETL